MFWALIVGLCALVLSLLVRPLIGGPRGWFAAGLVAGLTGLGALGLYIELGTPGLGDNGIEARLETLRARDPASLTPAEIRFVLEQRVRQQPEDAQAWEYVGTLRMAAGSFADAEAAFSRALRIDGPHVERLVKLAEARLRLADGLVTPSALKAVDAALALAPGNPGARLFKGMAAEQNDRMDEARQTYTALMDTAASPWSGIARMRLMALDGPPPGLGPDDIKGPASEGTGTKGPDAAAVAAARDMAPGDRMAMIEGMVAGLDARLRDNPDDLEGWLRLIRSYRVLGREDDRKDAIARARDAFSNQPDALEQLNAAAR
ncbi:MAG: tetratricopeptide repeat protein [Alphaproteobacteria bacterium]